MPNTTRVPSITNPPAPPASHSQSQHASLMSAAMSVSAFGSSSVSTSVSVPQQQNHHRDQLEKKLEEGQKPETRNKPPSLQSRGTEELKQEVNKMVKPKPPPVFEDTWELSVAAVRKPITEQAHPPSGLTTYKHPAQYGNPSRFQRSDVRKSAVTPAEREEPHAAVLKPAETNRKAPLHTRPEPQSHRANSTLPSSLGNFEDVW